MPFSFLVRPRPDQVRAARLDADTADRVAAVMRESNARLEERVRQLQSRVAQLERENQSLRTRADADSQAHLLKSRFLQHAETELRASFEAVVGFARLLWEEASLGQRPMLGSLLSGSQRMGKVIDQMAGQDAGAGGVLERVRLDSDAHRSRDVRGKTVECPLTT